MTPGARRAKGRRLQVLVAEELSVAFRLHIEAVKPTRPGTRANGSIYVHEGDAPDLRVRPSGHAGSDVALLSARARERVCLPYPHREIHWECKNTESWALDAAFWKGGISKFVTDAFEQAYADIKRVPSGPTRLIPVVVLGKNNYPPLAVIHGTGSAEQMWTLLLKASMLPERDGEGEPVALAPKGVKGNPKVRARFVAPIVLADNYIIVPLVTILRAIRLAK